VAGIKAWEAKYTNYLSGGGGVS